MEDNLKIEIGQHRRPVSQKVPICFFTFRDKEYTEEKAKWVKFEQKKEVDLDRLVETKKILDKDKKELTETKQILEEEKKDLMDILTHRKIQNGIPLTP